MKLNNFYVENFQLYYESLPKREAYPRYLINKKENLPEIEADYLRCRKEMEKLYPIRSAREVEELVREVVRELAEMLGLPTSVF